MRHILCVFGFHDWKYKEETVFQDGIFKTVNFWKECHHCGEVTEKMGATSFSMTFTVKDES